MRDINPHAPVQSRMSVVINSNSVDVWNILTDIDRWPEWQTNIKRAKLEGALKPGAFFKWKSGGMNIRSEIHTVEPYSLFGWSGNAFGLFAIHNWKITELNKQVEVKLEESMDGLLAKLFKKMLTGSLEKTNKAWLEMLMKECERMETLRKK